MDTDYTQESGRKGTLLTFLILMMAVLLPFSLMLAPYFLAIFTGGLLAIICEPAYERLRARGFGPRMSSTVITIILLVLVLVPLTLFVIGAVRQTILLVGQFGDKPALSFKVAVDWLYELPLVKDFLGEPEQVQAQLRSLSSSVLGGATSMVINFASFIPELLLQLVLAIFASFFFLMDGRPFLGWMARKIPLSSDIRSNLSASFRNTTVSVILATVVAAGVQSAIMLVTFIVLSVPAALLAAAATFIFAWVPMLGSFPVWAAGAVYLYLDGSMVKLVLMVLLGVLTSVADNVVRPMVLSGRDEMHPLVSIIAIFGGISMLGILGVFIGPILAAMVVAVLNTWPAVACKAGIRLGDGGQEAEQGEG